ncbi:hypothetical protein [Mesorhizobium sp. M1428]|uniref:hypothetical protein n=1 Tax=Mesorhizobium sp. M1428 TaxID=2957102 RepID=UPI003335EFCE
MAAFNSKSIDGCCKTGDRDAVDLTTPTGAGKLPQLVQLAQRVHDASKLTGSVTPGGMRSAGTDSTAQASDAHDERVARFS